MRAEGFSAGRRQYRGAYHILLVEDDPIQASVLKELLAAQRFAVVTAASAAEATAVMDEMHPDLYLIDASLHTHLDGLEFLQEVRRRDEQATCIVLSTDNDRAVALAALQAGADEFLQKPVSFGELSIRIQNLVQLINLREEAQELSRRYAREKQILVKYFPQRLLDSILNESSSEHLTGRYVTTTVLVYDLRNSTGLAESMPTSDFADLINQITADLIRIVSEHEGTVVRLTGDGIIASFLEDGPRHAVACAQHIASYQAEMEFTMSCSGVNLYGFGIGIGTGRVFEGHLGNFNRTEYTIIGNALERARRLEALTKRIPCPIAVDSVTHARLNSGGPFVPLKVQRNGRTTTVFGVLTGQVQP